MLKNLWRTVRFYDMNRRVLLSRICSSTSFCTADNSSQILKERIGLLAFATMTFNERNCGNGDFRFEYKKTKFDFYRLRSLAGWKVVGEQTWRKDKKKKYKLTDNPKKEKTRFGLSWKCLNEKKMTSFSLFDFKTDRKNELKNKKTEYLFVNLFSVQRLDFKKKENINLTTSVCVFGWKVR